MRLTRVLVPAAMAVALLAGCGGNDSGSSPSWSDNSPGSAAAANNGVADLTADEILAKATSALEKAGSYRISGKGTEDGEEMSLDLKFAGKDWGGTMTMQGSVIDLLVVDNQTFFKADANFWKEMGGPEGGSIVKLINDRWVTMGSQNMLGDLGEIADMAAPKTLLKPEGKVTKGEVKETEAGQAVALVDKTAKTTLYVATTGEPYPVLIDMPQGGMKISDFGGSFPEIKKPAENEFVDMSELSGS